MSVRNKSKRLSLRESNIERHSIPGKRKLLHAHGGRRFEKGHGSSSGLMAGMAGFASMMVAGQVEVVDGDVWGWMRAEGTKGFGEQEKLRKRRVNGRRSGGEY